MDLQRGSLKQKKEQVYAKQREKKNRKENLEKRCYMGNSSKIHKKLKLENLMLVRKIFLKKETKESIFAAND